MWHNFGDINFYLKTFEQKIERSEKLKLSEHVCQCMYNDYTHSFTWKPWKTFKFFQNRCNCLKHCGLFGNSFSLHFVCIHFFVDFLFGINDFYLSILEFIYDSAASRWNRRTATNSWLVQCYYPFAESLRYLLTVIVLVWWMAHYRLCCRSLKWDEEKERKKKKNKYPLCFVSTICARIHQMEK